MFPSYDFNACIFALNNFDCEYQISKYSMVVAFFIPTRIQKLVPFWKFDNQDKKSPLNPAGFFFVPIRAVRSVFNQIHKKI